MHLGRLADLRGKDPLDDQEDVAVETGTLMPSPHLADYAVQADPITGRQIPIDCYDIVELQSRARSDRDPELKRRGIVGAKNTAHDIAHLSPSRSTGALHGPVVAQTLIIEGTVAPTCDSRPRDGRPMAAGL